MTPLVQNPAVPAPKARRPKKSGLGLVIALLSFLGFGSLCFIAGAVVMHTGGPVARPLGQAFDGAKTWFGGNPVPHPGQPVPPGLSICKESAFDGLTLITTTEGAEAKLIDRAGKTVHRWSMPTDGPLRPGSVSWEKCHAFPDGSLLALSNSQGDTPYGVGLVKLDKEGKFLWHLKGKYHHDLEVGEDGRIHLLETTTVEVLPAGCESLKVGCLDERIVAVSPEGKVERAFSLLEAFARSPFLDVLLSANFPESNPFPDMAMPPSPPGGGLAFPPIPPPAAQMAELTAHDTFHANSLRLLPRSMAGKFPQFKAGHLLLSLRTPGLLAVLDLDKQAVVWATRGPWQRQHDAQFLPTGRLLVYDNRGGPKGTRVLEYDPATQAIPWRSGRTEETSFRAPFRGRCQRLPNGNTRITDPERRIFEVAGEEIVWQLGFPEDAVKTSRCFTSTTVYARDKLPFLK